MSPLHVWHKRWWVWRWTSGCNHQVCAAKKVRGNITSGNIIFCWFVFLLLLPTLRNLSVPHQKIPASPPSPEQSYPSSLSSNHQRSKHQAIGGEIKTYFTATRRVPGSAGEMSPFSFSEDSLRFLRKHLLSFPPFIFSALSTFAHFYHLLHGGSSVSVENIPNISASIKDSFCPLPFLVSLPGPFFSLFLLSHGVPSWWLAHFWLPSNWRFN